MFMKFSAKVHSGSVGEQTRIEHQLHPTSPAPSGHNQSFMTTATQLKQVLITLHIFGKILIDLNTILSIGTQWANRHELHINFT